jgi:hypothetical protein
MKATDVLSAGDIRPSPIRPGPASRESQVASRRMKTGHRGYNYATDSCCRMAMSSKSPGDAHRAERTSASAVPPGAGPPRFMTWYQAPACSIRRGRAIRSIRRRPHGTFTPCPPPPTLVVVYTCLIRRTREERQESCSGTRGSHCVIGQDSRTTQRAQTQQPAREPVTDDRPALGLWPKSALRVDVLRGGLRSLCLGLPNGTDNGAGGRYA